MICVISSVSILLYSSNRCHPCSPSKFWFVMSDRSVLRFEKNLSARSVVFSAWVCVVGVSFLVWPNSRIVVVSDFRKLLSLVHLFIFYIVFDWVVVLAISSLQYIIRAVCDTAFRHLYTVWTRSYMFCDNVLWYSFQAAFPSDIVFWISLIHHLATRPP